VETSASTAGLIVEVPRRSFSETQTVGSVHPPCDNQSYNGLKVRFSATLGEEPEIEVGLG
jgi:hypothetical protein